MPTSPEFLPSDSSAQPARHTTQVVIPVVAETLEIEQVAVQTGTVRVRKVVHQEAAAVELSEMHEAVETTRIPIDRVVDVAIGPHCRGDVLVVPVYEERWTRQLVLVEEVHVTKRRTVEAREEVVPLRREEVVVERFDPSTRQWRPAAMP